MNRTLLSIIGTVFFLYSAAQNVGIGTVNPLSKLHIKGGLLLDSSNGTTPVAGNGTRLMWVPAKAAFRAGKVNAGSWDDINIGVNSVAMGNSTMASGFNTTALGSFTSATGDYSTAMGFNAIAAGVYSTAAGTDTRASGTASTAFGSNTTASGLVAVAMGSNTISKSYSGLVIGAFNDSANAANAVGFNPFNRIFQVGNGTADNARNNALTVLQNGNVGIGTVSPLSQLHVKGGLLMDSSIGTTPVSGAGTRFMWIPSKATFRAGSVSGNQWDNSNIGNFSVAAGYDCKASGPSSVAFGNVVTAGGYASVSMGSFNTASGDYAAVFGKTNTASGSASMVVGGNSSATGDYAVAAGTNTNAVGNASLALGYSLWSASFAGLVVGSCNDTSDAPNQNTFNPLNRIFQVGNGTANNVRSNALTVLQNGNVGIGVLHPAQMLEVAANITVQNGKGIIRSADGTQLKKLTTSVAVNVTLSAGSTTAYNFTFPENFSGTPDVYVGNVISGAGGWAEVVMSIANVTPGGGTLYVNNPRTGNWSPVFTVKIIAIGPQ